MPLLLPPAISALKINPQNPSLGSYQPTTLRTSERDGPVAGHTGKCEPSVPFIGCPSRASRTSHHHSLVRIGFIMVFAFGSATLANLTCIAQPKYCPYIWLLIRDRPGLAAIARGRCLRRGWGQGIEIPTADDPVPRISESHAEYACARRTPQR